jgi:hypothetical protein
VAPFSDAGTVFNWKANNVYVGTSSNIVSGQAIIVTKPLPDFTPTISLGGIFNIQSQTATTVATATALSSMVDTSGPTASVTLTASVSAGTPGAGPPTGSVDFLDTTTGVDLGTVALVNGQATLTVSSLSVGDHSITATYGGNFQLEDSSASATVTVPPGSSTASGSPAAIAATAGTGQSATVGAAFTSPLQATVTDALGNPVAGATVTFTAPGSGASGTFAGGSASATVTTDAHGVATAPAFTANGTAGGYSVTATVSGVASSANFTLLNLAAVTSTGGTSTGQTPPGSGASSGSTSPPAGSMTAPGSDSAQQFVTQFYQKLLGRPGDPQGTAFWQGRLAQGESEAQVGLDVYYTPEYLTDEVGAMYQRWLGRAADPQGMNFYVQLLAAGGTLQQVEADFLASPEYYQGHGNSIAGFLAALYQDGLGRGIDASGQAAYSLFLLRDGSRQAAILLLLSSDEGVQHMVEDLSQQLVKRSADAGGLAFWVDLLKKGGRVELLIATLLGSDEYSAPSA